MADAAVVIAIACCIAPAIIRSRGVNRQAGLRPYQPILPEQRIFEAKPAARCLAVALAFQGADPATAKGTWHDEMPAGEPACGAAGAEASHDYSAGDDGKVSLATGFPQAADGTLPQAGRRC